MFICESDATDTDTVLRLRLRLRLLVIKSEVTVENLTAARDMLQTGTVLGSSRLREKNSF